MNIRYEEIPYADYPNPKFRRQGYTLLDGWANIAFFDENGKKAKEGKILLPYAYETEASGVGDEKMYPHIEYDFDFEAEKNRPCLLRFLAVDYACNVFLNGVNLGKHKGGYTEFYFDVSDVLIKGKNHLHVEVDDSYSPDQLRGKQRCRPENYECWYVQTSGIYQSVYLEECGSTYVSKCLFSGDKSGKVDYLIELNRKENIEWTISFKGRVIRTFSEGGKRIYKGVFYLENPRVWNVNEPNLYDVRIRVLGEIEDRVETYFGCRSIETARGNLYVNGQREFLKLILNQGYREKKGVSLSKRDVFEDFVRMKEFGFNGCRIHQKIEIPFMYYLADLFGFYLWNELPSCYRYSPEAKEEIERELFPIIDRNYNSPSIIVHLLFNESWGIPEIKASEETQNYVASLVERVRKYDPSRLIVANDGWNNLSCSDLISLHEYEQNAEVFFGEYRDKDRVIEEKIVNGYGKALADRQFYRGQPIVISEFGGVSLSNQNGWGYGEKAADGNDLEKRISSLLETIGRLDYLSGYCYCQLTDVEQETNGLLTADRKCKLNAEEIRKIVEGVKL